MLGPTFASRNSASRTSYFSMALACLMVVLMALSYLPLASSEGRGDRVEVWFKSIRHDTEDSDEDRNDDTAIFGYDVDTDASNGTEVEVRLYVKNSNGSYVDDPVDEYFVANGTEKFRYMNWTAEYTDNFTFELKLYHDDNLKEKETYHIYLTEAEEDEDDIEVWYEDVIFRTRDTNEDDSDDSVTFAYDIDTDADRGTEVVVKLYVKNSNNKVIDDPAQEHAVYNDTEKYHHLNWTAEETDNFTFELKLYHDHKFIEKREYRKYLVGTESDEKGELKVWSLNDYKPQNGALYIEDDLYDDYYVKHGEHHLVTISLDPGTYNVTLALNNNATDTRRAVVEKGERNEVELRPDDGSNNTGTIRVYIENQYNETQEGSFYIDNVKESRQEFYKGKTDMGEYVLEKGEHSIAAEFDNDAEDEKEFMLYKGDYKELTLKPTKDQQRKGWVRILAKNDYDAQNSSLHLDDELAKVKYLETGEAMYGEFELAAGRHHAKLTLANEAKHVVQFEVHADKTVNISMRPTKAEKGKLEFKAHNRFSKQWSHLYVDGELLDEFELPTGISYMTQKDYEPGEYKVKLVLENRALAILEVEVKSGHETSIQLEPEYDENTINVRGWVTFCYNCTTLDALEFAAKIRGEAVKDVEIKVYGPHRGEALKGYTNKHGYYYTGQMDPGVYEWTAHFEDEKVGEGTLQVHDELGRSAMVEVAPHSFDDKIHWNLAKFTIFSNESRTKAGALVKFYLDDELLVEQRTNEDGLLELKHLPQGYYSYSVHWPSEGRGGQLLLSEGEFFSYGPGREPRLVEAEITPMKGSKDTIFKISVAFIDDLNRKPDWVQVYIDDNHYLLQRGEGLYPVGDWYAKELDGKAIAVGTHNHTFKAKFGTSILETEVRVGPTITEEIKPHIQIKDPKDGDKLTSITIVTLKAEAYSYAPYDIYLDYCMAAQKDDGRQAGGDGVSKLECVEPTEDGRQAIEDPFTLLTDFEQKDDGHLTYSYEWQTDDLEAGDYLLRARIYDYEEFMDEHIIKLIKPGDTDPEDPKAGVAVAIEPLVQTTHAGRTATFTVTVTNTGDHKDTFTLTSAKVVNSSESGWTIAWETSTLTIDAGSFKQTEVMVKTPENASTKDVLLLTVVASSELDAAVTGSAIASVIIVGPESEGGVLPGLSTPAAILGITAGVVVASFRRRLYS